MIITVEISEKELREMVIEKLSHAVGVELLAGDVDIQVKSKQNYRAEWETAAFRARVSKSV